MPTFRIETSYVLCPSCGYLMESSQFEPVACADSEDVVAENHCGDARPLAGFRIGYSCLTDVRDQAVNAL